MKIFRKITTLFFIFAFFYTFQLSANEKIAYLVSDIRIPFWEIMSKGIESKAKKLGYDLSVYSANNIKKTELENTIKAISSNIDALVISPINSSTAVTILGFAKKANIPVVILDIGTDDGEYLSFISSDNEQGGYAIGKVLTKELIKLGWQDGGVGIVSIPQKRKNGKARTRGFLKALNEDGIKNVGLHQQVNFSYEETYEYSMKLIKENPNLKAIWLQGSDRYKGALDAIKDSGNLGKILLLCFDAEPIFLELIPQGVLVGSAMQQPFLMGEKSVELIDKHLNGLKVKKEIKVDILAISKDNIDDKMSIIKRNVLGLKKDE